MTSTSVAPARETATANAWETPSNAALMWLIVGGLFLTVGGIVLAVAAAQQVSPGLLTTGPMTSVGRLAPAGQHLVLWGGFGMLAAGAAFDVVRRLAHAPLQLEKAVLAGGALTTFGVLGGAGAILVGHSTGRAGLEMPRLFAIVVALGQVLVAVVIMRTLAHRDRDELHPALAHIAAAVVAAPMVLLVGSLPRVAGVNDAIVTTFSTSGLILLWLLPLGAGLALYVVAAECRAPLYSPGLAAVGFWGWVAIAPFAAMARLVGGPGQEWLESIGIAASILLVIPVLAVALNIFRTYGSRLALAPGPAARLGVTGAGLMVLYVVLRAVGGLRTVADLLHLTLFDLGVDELALLGAVAALVIAGVLHGLSPLAGAHLVNPRRAARIAGVLAVGIALVTIGLGVAGYVQGALFTAGVRSGVPTFTGAGWQTVSDLVRPLLWLRVIGEWVLVAAWVLVFQQIFSTATSSEPLVPGEG